MELKRGIFTRIAEQAGISRQYLHNILAGRREPKGNLPDRLRAAAEALGIKHTTVFDWIDPPNSKHPLFRAFNKYSYSH